MKKFLLALVFLALTNYMFAQQKNPEGAYSILKAQHGDSLIDAAVSKSKMIKILKDGFWIVAHYGEPDKPFIGTGGGTFTIKGDQYNEKLTFFSFDSSAVGRNFTFSYTLQGDKFLQNGVIHSENYPNFKIDETWVKISAEVPLQDASLEGVWKLEKGQNENVQGFEQIKMYSYPRFGWAQYNLITNQLIGAGGGTYKYDGKKLYEKIDYFTYDVALNTVFEFKIDRPSDSQFQQTFINIAPGSKETWNRMK